jgi:hypothetical protein
MAVLFIGAMALIFYILLLRAQHLASMERQRENPDPEARIVQIAAEKAPPVILHSPTAHEAPIPHILTFASTG